MVPERLPHLRVARFATEPFRSPRGGGGAERQPPERNPPDHADRLLRNLDQLEVGLRERDQVVPRPPEAEGHLVAANALEGFELPSSSLADKRAEIVLVAESDDRALLHVRRDDLAPLRRKIKDYGNDQKRTSKGRPRNEPLVASLEGFRAATLADLSEGLLTEATVEHGHSYWVELWMRGGHLEEEAVRNRVRGEVEWLAARVRLDAGSVRRFRATERDIFLVSLPGEVLHALPTLLPEAYRVVPASPGLSGLLLSEIEAEVAAQFAIDPPGDDAAGVVLLDTGVAPQHPLLRPGLTSGGTSAVVGDLSPIDTHGHGTEMAGLAGYADLAQDLLGGAAVSPRVWLTSVRLIADDQEDDADREFWPERTEEAVRAGEAEAPPKHVFNLSIGAANRDSGVRTSWSVGVDLLAHNDGAGRLFCVAAGNVDVSPQRDQYPALNLVSFIDDPGQALNAVTVGAVTRRTAIPADPVHGQLQALAGEDELSPYARTGVSGGPIKPDVAFEGGNCAPDGAVQGTGIGSLSLLTTNRRHVDRGLTTFSWATSAACASVSGLAAEIWRVTGVDRAETVRALLIHSARWSDATKAQFPDSRDRVRAVGYGVPDGDLASYSFRQRPTVVIEDSLRPRVEHPDGSVEREVHFVRLPLPEQSLLDLSDHEVELSVTLSFFVEPNEANRRNYAGAMLRWDVQRPAETEADFRQRVNRLDRAPGFEAASREFAWEIGVDRRSRGSVQSDRCRLPAALLAGDRQIAVFPALGWWDGREQRKEAAVPYSLVVTIDAGDADIDLYSEISAAIALPVELV